MVAINVTSLAIVSTSELTAGEASGSTPSISGTGRYVAFTSAAFDLISTPDSNAAQDVFLRDMDSGDVTLVSRARATNTSGDQDSFDGYVSDDGRFVVFNSLAEDIVPNSAGGTVDVFLRDLASQRTVRLSVTELGVAADNQTYARGLSGDGRYVLIETFATNLFAGDGNGAGDIIVRDLLTGSVSVASVSTAGTLGNSDSIAQDMSHDGRYVLFASDSTNLVSGDTNGTRDLFKRDMLEGTTTRISVSTAGVQGNLNSLNGAISANGRYVVFDSTSTNFVAGDTSGADVFLRDTNLGTTIRLSQFAGVGGNADSREADISGSGRYVVFTSLADNLAAGDTNGVSDIFLRDLGGGTMTRISLGINGAQANGRSYDPHISEDGRFVTFISEATNLVLGTDTAVGRVYRISLFASEAADHLFGTAGADQIAGLGGSDIIDGGTGADQMNGGFGNDTIYVDNAADSVIESVGQGADTVIASANFTLGAAAEVEYFRAANLGDAIARNLVANNFSQSIFGTAGVNAIDSKGGNDRMWGGLGNDSFVFSSALNQTTNVDRIEDFSNVPGNDDRILLENAIFTQLTATGVLSANLFAANATGTALDADDRIVYNTTSGQLFYDSNGSAAGGATWFAILTGAPTLTAADFLVY